VSFNKHSRVPAGAHAFLSPSNYYWLEYDEDKMRRVFYEKQAVKRGTELHEYAQKAISLGLKQPDNRTTLCAYINDAIGFRMTPEVPLFYSPECFGTADTLGFRNNILRVHDLKTGSKEADMRQLLIYAALFCFEYKYVPSQIKIILRIYQNDDIDEYEPSPMEILQVMDRIQSLADFVTRLREEDD
jgi:hypothetical protein